MTTNSFSERMLTPRKVADVLEYIDAIEDTDAAFAVREAFEELMDHLDVEVVK